MYVNRSRYAKLRAAPSAKTFVDPRRVRHLLGPSSQDHGLANSDRRCCCRRHQRTTAPLGIELNAYAEDAHGGDASFAFTDGLVCSSDHRREFASDASWDDSPDDRHDGASNASWVAIVSRRCSRTSNASWVPCSTPWPRSSTTRWGASVDQRNSRFGRAGRPARRATTLHRCSQFRGNCQSRAPAANSEFSAGRRICAPASSRCGRRIRRAFG